jgi:hypothetical protein
MKLTDVCRGCGARRLVNHLKLCKRCNKEASHYLSKQDIAAAKAEREALLAAKAELKAQEELEKAEAEAAKAEAATAEGEAEEGEEKKEEPKEGEKAKDGDKEDEKKEKK